MGLWLGFSMLSGLIGSFLIARLGGSLGFVDEPNIRSSHHVTIPKGGGIGLLVVIVVGAIWWKTPWALWIPAIMVSVVSFTNDYREMSFKIRLVAQFSAAVIFCGVLFLGDTPLDISAGLTVLFFLFGVLFIVGTTNYYNFMDGINGIAGLTGIIAFTGLGIYGLIEGKDSTLIMTAFGIAAACLGFLPFNFPRAKVFMGDVGSILLGFLFASWVLWHSQSFLEFVVLAALIFPFYADEFHTIISRIKAKENLIRAHRRHIYQILVNQAGLPHAVVTIGYGVVQILVGISTWLLMKEGLFAVMGLLAGMTGLFFVVGNHIRRRFEEESPVLMDS